MTIQEVLNRTQKFFKSKGFETARLDAELILSHSLGWPRVQLYTKFDYPMNEEELELCREKVRRRATGEPIAYILEMKSFFNHDFFVNPNVLIPRPDTESLVEKVIETLSDRKEEPLVFADFGVGSGCIGLSLLKEWPAARMIGVDISSEAIEVAKKNAEKLEVSDRVTWVCKSAGELSAQDFSEPLDLIVANPPYIAESDERVLPAVREFEPSTALFSENEGLADPTSWTQKAQELFTAWDKSGSYFCEVGDGQKKDIEGFLNEQGWLSKAKFHKDLAGKDRFFEVQF